MIIVAPEPAVDSDEVPLTFVAEILACTLEFKLKENGAAVNTDRGIVHCVADLMVLSEPSQLTVSAEYVIPSLYNIVII